MPNYHDVALDWVRYEDGEGSRFFLLPPTSVVKNQASFNPDISCLTDPLLIRWKDRLELRFPLPTSLF